MRFCPTLNNNITNNYKTELTMTEDAPNATDHDDDSKRIASSYNYDLPNQEQDDDDVFKWEDQDDAPNAIDDVFKWEDHDDAPNAFNHYDDDGNVSFVPPMLLDVFDEVARRIEWWVYEQPDHDNNDSFLIYDSFLPPGLITLYERIESILDEWTIVMNGEIMNEDVIKPIRDMVRRDRADREAMYRNEYDEDEIERKWKESTRRRKTRAEILTTRMSTALEQKSEASSISDRNPKEIKSTNVRDRDLNFDRDNPSLSPLSSNRASSQDASPQEDNDNKEPCTMLFKKWKDKREVDEAKVKQLRERVRRECRVERRKRRKAESHQLTTIMTSSSTHLEQKSEAKESPSSERVTNSDANFDRDNPSLSNIVSPSSECIINYDANFDRDNPAFKLPPVQSIKPPSMELPPLSTIKSPSNALSPSNNNINEVLSIKLLQLSFNVLSPSERVTNSDTKFDHENPSLPALSWSASNDPELPPSSNNNINEVLSIKSPPSWVSSNVLSHRTANKSSSNDNRLQPSSNNQNNSKVQPTTASNAPPLSNIKNNNINKSYNNNVGTATRIRATSILPLLQSIKPPSMELPLSSSFGSLRSSLQSLDDTRLRPWSNNNNNSNNKVLNQNNNESKVTIQTVPVTSRTTREVKSKLTVPVTTSRTTRKVKSKLPGTIPTTKYSTTSTRPNILVTQESKNTKINDKYDETENHVTGKWKFSTTRSKISITHEEARSKYAATENHITETPSTRSNISITHEEASTGKSNVLKLWEFSSTRPNISIAHEEASTTKPESSQAGSNNSITHEEASTGKPTVLKPWGFLSTRPNISIAHEETSTQVLKSWEFSSARLNISIAHGSKYTGNIDKYTLNDKPRSKILSTHEIRGKPTVKLKINMVLEERMNTKYATSTEQSSTHIIDKRSFCSQYLQTVLKITNNNGNNNGIFNDILISSLNKSITPHHPFIEYLQPEPEPPPLNSYFLLFLFLFIGTTKQKVVLFISELLYYFNNIYSLSLTLIKNQNSETLSYINNIKNNSTDTPCMVQFILFCSTYRI
jgi:hypothetical protein